MIAANGRRYRRRNPTLRDRTEKERERERERESSGVLSLSLFFSRSPLLITRLRRGWRSFRVAPSTLAICAGLCACFLRLLFVQPRNDLDRPTSGSSLDESWPRSMATLSNQRVLSRAFSLLRTLDSFSLSCRLRL